MRPAFGNLASIIAGQNVYLTADCYDIGALKITGYAAGLAGYSATGFGIEHGAARSVLGLEDPTVTLVIHCDTTVSAAASFLSSAASGTYDGAVFKWTRYYMATPGDSSSYLIPFVGVVAECRASTSKVEIQAGSPLGQLDTITIARPIQAQCPWSFKDANCGYVGSTTSCDKTVATCQSLSNLTNFGGFPYAPAQGVNLKSV